MFLDRKLAKVEWESVHFIEKQELKKQYLDIQKVCEENEILLLELPPGEIRSDDDIFLKIAEVMKFPDYFGRNWNALDECLRDLESWMPAKGYVLLIPNSKDLWANNLLDAGKLIESWLFCAEEWSKENIPFHLVFIL